MWSVPQAKFVIDTPLAPDVVRARLGAALNPRAGTRLPATLLLQPLSGLVSHTEFRVCIFRPYPVATAPEARGVIASSNGGTRLQGVIEATHPATGGELTELVWTGFVLILAPFTGLLAAATPEPQGRLMASVVATAFLAAGVLRRRAYQEEARRLARLLAVLVEASAQRVDV